MIREFYLSDRTRQETNLAQNPLKENALMFSGVPYNLGTMLKRQALQFRFTESNSHNPRNDILRAFLMSTFRGTTTPHNTSNSISSKLTYVDS